ncbi:MAG: hypothetical protein HQ546_01620 [Planctomycetes bacterium]|nr:hypothetical protein [Planctomycetota bacterium]
MKKVKAIVLLGIPVLLFVAVLILILNNMDKDWRLKLFTTDIVGARRGVVLFLAAVVAVIVWSICRICLPAGIRAVRALKEKKQTTAQGTQQSL